MVKRRIIYDGFSLIEIMIVLGLFAMIGGLVVYNLDTLIKNYTHKSFESIFFEALRGARFEALTLQQPVYLRYDHELMAFYIENQSHTRLNIYSIISDDVLDPKDFAVEFFLRLPGESASHALKPEVSKVPLSHVLCTPQGYMPPFQVVLSQQNEKEILWVDPFSARKLTIF